MDLDEQLAAIIDTTPTTPAILADFRARLAQGALVKEENEQSHFCVYFLPRNPVTGEVFIVHHKKAGKWLAPGGHIDLGETVDQTLRREVHEELGCTLDASIEHRPFLLTVTVMDNPPHPCIRHYDIWHLLSTNGRDFEVDPREFHETRWLSIAAARKIVTDPNNLLALETIR